MVVRSRAANLQSGIAQDDSSVRDNAVKTRLDLAVA
jgi:hypothetical protein